MKYDKQDLPKIVVLSLVLIGVVIYIGVSYARLSAKYKQDWAAHTAHHTHTDAVPPSASPGEPGPVGSSAQAPASPAIAALLAPIPPPDRDPFLPLIASTRYAAARAENASGRASTEQTKKAAPVELPPLFSSVGSETPAPRDSDLLHLTGIILGPPSLAVMRRGDDHFIVQTGDELPGRVRVQTITRNAVTLRDNGRDYVLKLGS